MKSLNKRFKDIKKSVILIKNQLIKLRQIKMSHDPDLDKVAS